jgi:pyridoxine/pyridoxamine 5'-phosphate oxidase
MNRAALIEFVRGRGLAVVATRTREGDPEAALVGITATDRGDLVFDTSRRSRKYANLQADQRVAVVIGWDDELTVQIEGNADEPSGDDRQRCLEAYFAQHPDGRDRAKDPDITHIRIKVNWLRYSDYRAESFVIEEATLD